MPNALLAALAGVLFGYDTGVISGAILFINQAFYLTPTMTAWVVTAVLIGASIGAICSGRLCDHYGRRRLLFWDAQIFILGTLWSSLAPDVTHLVCSRILVGIAIGVASYTAPTYIAEISLPHQRGGRVSYNQLAIASGILLSYLVNAYLAESGAWRLMLAIGIVPAIGLALAMLKLPESPRWLVSKGHIEDARDILTRIGGCVFAEDSLRTIEGTLSHKTGTLKTLLFSRWRITLFIGAGLAVIQQVTGINTILYYAPTIFSMAGFGSNSAAIISTIGIGVMFVVASLVAIPLVDTLGRKPLLYIGLTLMTLGLLLVSLGLSSNMGLLLGYQRFLLVSSMIMYVVGFAISLGPVVWLMIAEIFPLSVRGLGSSLATTFNWIANGAVAFAFIKLVESLGLPETFIFFAATCVASILFIYWFVPETRGCTLEKIEQNLNSGMMSRALGV